MKYTRRDLIKQGMSLGAVAFASRLGMLNALASTTPGDYKALVFIYLDGGNDGFNTIVPMDPTDYGTYSAARPRVALPLSSLLRINPLADPRPYGLNPNMPELSQLWGAKKMAVVCNVGTLLAPVTVQQYNTTPSVRPLNLFSHSDQQRAIQMLDPNATSGWGQSIAGFVNALNIAPRLPILLNVSSNTAFYMAGTLPYITLQPGVLPTLQGAGPDPVSQARYRALRTILNSSSSSSLVRVLGSGTSNSIDQAQLASSVLGSVNLSTQFPTDGLGPQLLQIAQLIKARATLGQDRRQVFFASLGGFDTHAAQTTAHADLLKNLSSSLAAFYNATVEMGVADSVTSFTLSEFGRTVQDSGDGTDHAWGGHSFVVGGSVKGGDFYGTYPSLVLGGPDDIDQGSSDARGRILPTVAVDQMAATLAGWFGLDNNAIASAIPNIGRFSPANLGFMAG